VKTQKDKKRENAKMINFDKIVKMTENKKNFIKKDQKVDKRKKIILIVLPSKQIKRNSALPGITSLMKRFNVVDLLHRLFIRSFSNQAHPIT